MVGYARWVMLDGNGQRSANENGGGVSPAPDIQVPFWGAVKPDGSKEKEPAGGWDYWLNVL